MDVTNDFTQGVLRVNTMDDVQKPLTVYLSWWRYYTHLEILWKVFYTVSSSTLSKGFFSSSLLSYQF